MKSKTDKFMMSFFLPIYIIFTVICFGIGCLFAEQRIMAFQIWYQVTALIRLILAIAVIILLAKLCKVNKLKNEMKHWKE